MDDAQLYVIIRDGGPRLAKLVDSKFPTRAKFASAALISVSDASRFCNGKRKPPQHIVSRIAAALGVVLPDVEIPKTALTKALDRTVRALKDALTIEQQSNDRLEERVAQIELENRDLRKKLDKVRQIAN